MASGAILAAWLRHGRASSGMSVMAGGADEGTLAPPAPTMCCWPRRGGHRSHALGQRGYVHCRWRDGVVSLIGQGDDIAGTRFTGGVLSGLETHVYSLREFVGDFMGGVS